MVRLLFHPSHTINIAFNTIYVADADDGVCGVGVCAYMFGLRAIFALSQVEGVTLRSMGWMRKLCIRVLFCASSQMCD